MSTRNYVGRLCPWLPYNFFETLDVCENAMLLEPTLAHPSFGSFEWFVVMETDADGNTIYKAMQVEENDLLSQKYD